MSARYEIRRVGVFDNKALELITPMDGEAWAAYEAWRAEGNDPDPPPAADAITLEEALARKMAEIEDRAATQRRAITGPVSAQEMSSWTLKYDQALAYDPAVGDASAPMLALEAKARGVATDEIVARVKTNAAAYSKAEAAIAGNAGRHKDAVRQLADALAVLAYDASSGWPIAAADAAPRDAVPPP
jgi:hypothetical protein